MGNIKTMGQVIFLGKRREQLIVGQRSIIVKPKHKYELPIDLCAKLTKTPNWQADTSTLDELHRVYYPKSPNEWIDGYLNGSRCFLLGSGKSLKGFDFNRLNNDFTIALNHTIRFYPDAKAVMFVDRQFPKDIYKENGKEKKVEDFLKTYNGYIFSAVRSNYHNLDKRKNVIPFELNKFSPQNSFKYGIYSGILTGVAALNLAIVMNAKEIYLMGYDFDNEGDKNAYFWDRNKNPYQGKRRKSKMRAFNKFGQWKDIVYNCYSKSGLEMFKFADIDKVLDDKNVIEMIQEEPESRIYYVVPARKGSKELPMKNRELYKYTFDVLNNFPNDNVIITTDDNQIATEAEVYGFNVEKCDPKLYGDAVCLQDVLIDLINKKGLSDNDIIVMLYLTYPERTYSDIKKAIKFFKDKDAKSLLCKKEPKTNPYLCFVENGVHGDQVVNHDLFRRQDYPKIFEISHYIFISYVSEIPNLKKNLFNERTIFFPIRDVIDVDRKEDIEKFAERKRERKKKLITIKGDYKTPMPPLDPDDIISDKDSEKLLNFKFISIEKLREFIRGKKVICVSNSGSLRNCKKGNYIDSFDIVIRFNSFALNKQNTGKKLSIHAMTHNCDYNLQIPCDIRVVLCGKDFIYWRHFIRNKIQKDKQQFLVKDKWFYNSKIFNEFNDMPKIMPTTGLSIVRLLLWAGSYKSLHLFGFDFSKSKKPYRQTTGFSTIHNYDYEKKWISNSFQKKSRMEYMIEGLSFQKNKVSLGA